MAQTNQTNTNQTNTTGSSDTAKLSEVFDQKANISGSSGGGAVKTTYDPNVQPPISGFEGHRGRYHGPGHCYHHGPHQERESLFDVQTAYQKHYASIQSQRGSQQQQQQQQQQVPQVQSAQTSSTSTTAPTEAEREAEYKANKAEEQAEVAKFEVIRSEVNALITSQDWNNMASKHVHELGSKLREFERRFWNLKPTAEQLVLKGRNTLAEKVDLAEEELLHAIVVVSQIYRQRVKAAAHAKYPGKVHPRDRHFIGNGHPGHPGYNHPGNYGVQPYHGHPAMGSGGYY